MSHKCKRCGENVKESDPDVEVVHVGQNICGHFTKALYHRECLSRDHIDALKENLEQAEARVKELESKLDSVWHIANCYDGDHAKACDLIMDTVKEASEDE